MAGVAWAAGRRAGIAAVVIAALVALSRVYLGVHWPTDVLAGAAWGLACAWVGLAAALGAVRLIRRPFPKRAGDGPAGDRPPPHG
jgi:undecaprenyl-diphosphatase